MGRIPENTAGNRGGGRQLAVSKVLQLNTGREVQKVRWKEMESKRTSYENLQWRRKLISDTVAKARGLSIATDVSVNNANIVKKFGA